MRPPFRWLVSGWTGLMLALAGGTVGGCAGGGGGARQITIAAQPADADLMIDQRNVGHGPVTERFKFPKDEHRTYTITANRRGYKPQTYILRESYDKDRVVLALAPRTRRVTIAVAPLPAVVNVDGRPVSPSPVAEAEAELEFRLDAQEHWVGHTATVQRPGFRPAQFPIRWEDQTNRYTVRLEPAKKPVRIVTTPPGAEVFLNGESRGVSPVTIEALDVPFDAGAKRWEKLEVKAVKPGFEPGLGSISWDNGRTEYTLELGTRSKSVHVITDPPDAKVTVDGADLRPDDAGGWSGMLAFPPADANGTLKVYSGTAVKKTPEAEWETVLLKIGWDDGREEYRVSLAKRSQQVPLVRPAFTYDPAAKAWRVSAERVMTTARTDVAEPDGRRPTRVTTLLPAGTMIDTLAVSPDGQQVVFSVLKGSEKGELSSQLFTAATDGTGVPHELTDGKSLDLDPSYTPDGAKVVFSSTRGEKNTPAAGARPRLWWTPADRTGTPEPLPQAIPPQANGALLSPMLDSMPGPRLFYEALLDGNSEPRLFTCPLAAKADPVFGGPDDPPANPTDLRQPGRQPRISPKADRVLFTLADPKTAKRDLHTVPDTGAPATSPTNLTNTPDYDDTDPAWSRDGRRIAFASDRPVGGTGSANSGDYNLWIMDVDHPDQARPVTTNASHDDCPAWDSTGRALYFRSNRGGEWAIWKLELRDDLQTDSTQPTK